MSKEEDDEKRLYQCVKKYEIIVKQFDELVEMMNARSCRITKKPRVISNNKGSSSTSTTAAASSNQVPEDDEAVVQTITRFLQELKSSDAERSSNTGHHPK